VFAIRAGRVRLADALSRGDRSGSVWIQAQVPRVTRTAVAAGERIPGGDEIWIPGGVRILFSHRGEKDSRQRRRVERSVEVRSGHFAERRTRSGVLCQTGRGLIDPPADRNRDGTRCFTEKSREILAPRSGRRGGDRGGKIGASGGKRLAGGSVGRDTLFH
jgi:hypothetical protein